METALDRAQGAMQANPDDDTLRRAYYASVAAGEMFLLLDAPPGDNLLPRIIEMDTVRYVLAFDTEERLATFAEGAAPYAAMSGRALIALVQGEGAALGVGINLGVSEHAMLLPPEVLDWMAQKAAPEPALTERRLGAVFPPSSADAPLLAVLDRCVAGLAGQASGAWLVETRDEDTPVLLLAVTDAAPHMRGAIAGAVTEALQYAGLETPMDTVFATGADRWLEPVERTGLRFDAPVPPGAAHPAAPGMDPDRPPKLK